MIIWPVLSEHIYLSILVMNLVLFILFFISDNTPYFGNDGYVSLISKLTYCSSLLNFSSFMFFYKIVESLIKLSYAVICYDFFDKILPILYTAEFFVLIIT